MKYTIDIHWGKPQVGWLGADAYLKEPPAPSILPAMEDLKGESQPICLMLCREESI